MFSSFLKTGGQAVGLMNFYEREIAKCERRIKRIEERPDPTKLQSTKLFYALERDFRKTQLRNWQEGIPFAVGDLTAPLLRAMGFEVLDLEMGADRAMDHADEYFGTICAAQYPEHACDRTVMCIPMLLAGEIPMPHLVVSATTGCLQVGLSNNAIAHHLGIPVFQIDVDFEANYESLRHVARQLYELIAFIESRFPSMRYDEDKLVEFLKIDRQGFQLYRKIYDLKKRVPCPLAPRDAFRQERVPSYYSEPARIIEWLQAYVDELRARADSGSVPIKQEVLRLMWAVSGPYYGDVFGYLERRNVSLPVFQHGVSSRNYGVRFGVYGDETEYGRKLSPLEELARMFNQVTWCGLADRWIDDCLFICRDLQIDAIVNFIQMGCSPTVGLGKLLADAAENRLGLPTLQLEGRAIFQEGFSQQQTEEMLGEFIDMCLERKQMTGRRDHAD